MTKNILIAVILSLINSQLWAINPIKESATLISSAFHTLKKKLVSVKEKSTPEKVPSRTPYIISGVASAVSLVAVIGLLGKHKSINQEILDCQTLFGKDVKKYEKYEKHAEELVVAKVLIGVLTVSGLISSIYTYKKKTERDKIIKNIKL